MMSDDLPTKEMAERPWYALREENERLRRRVSELESWESASCKNLRHSVRDLAHDHERLETENECLKHRITELEERSLSHYIENRLISMEVEGTQVLTYENAKSIADQLFEDYIANPVLVLRNAVALALVMGYVKQERALVVRYLRSMRDNEAYYDVRSVLDSVAIVIEKGMHATLELEEDEPNVKQEEVKRMILEEREACAKACEEWGQKAPATSDDARNQQLGVAMACAMQIRWRTG